MNDRQFAAAHDRYLDPPDEDFDDSEEDEDSAYDLARQRRLEEEDYVARKAEWEKEEWTHTTEMMKKLDNRRPSQWPSAWELWVSRPDKNQGGASMVEFKGEFNYVCEQAYKLAEKLGGTFNYGIEEI